MFENVINFLKNIRKNEQKQEVKSKYAAKERLQLVLMQDRANISADFLDLMKQEIIEVIKKYIDVDETAIDVRLTNKENGDGTTGAPSLFANIPILNIRDEVKQGMSRQNNNLDVSKEESKDKENSNEENSVEENVPKETENTEVNKEETSNIENNFNKEQEEQEKNEEIKNEDNENKEEIQEG